MMKYYTFLFLLLALISCSKPEENFIKIPSEFEVSLEEEITNLSSRVLWLELSSMNNEYCPNDSLVYNVSSNINTLSINITSSYRANDCYQKNNNLKTRIQLPNFTDSLQIELNLSTASLINFTVFNNKNDYNIAINQGTGLTKKHPKTFKIPTNLIWGYAYPKSVGPASEVLMVNFKKDIEFDCDLRHLSKGYYSYFSILENNVLVLNENPGIAGNYLNFYYTHYKSEDQLIQFFDNLGSKYVDLVGYKINSGFGKEFKSN